MIRFHLITLILDNERIPLGKTQLKEVNVLIERDLKIPPYKVVANSGRLENPNEKGDLWYQVIIPT